MAWAQGHGGLQSQSFSQGALQRLALCARWQVLRMRVTGCVEGAVRHGPASSPTRAGGEPPTAVASGATARVEQDGGIL